MTDSNVQQIRVNRIGRDGSCREEVKHVLLEHELCLRITSEDTDKAMAGPDTGWMTEPKGGSDDKRKSETVGNADDKRKNDGSVYNILCTNTDLRELCYGRLFTDGIIGSAEDIASISFDSEKKTADIKIRHRNHSADDHTVKSIPGLTSENINEGGSENSSDAVCVIKPDKTSRGRGGADDDHTALPEYDKEVLFSLLNRISEDSPLHRITHSTHSCALAQGDDILYRAEDISRHNAVDKVIGFGLIQGIDFSECMLYTSGRVPSDMLEKVRSAGVKILISRASPTLKSYEMAARFGIRILCNAGPEGFTEC